MKPINNGEANDKPSRKRFVGWFFVVTTFLVLIYWLGVNYAGIKLHHHIMVCLWSIFYISCFAVMIYGWKKSAALEGVVYAITIIAEAVAPGFCIYLVQQLDTTVDVAILNITCYLMLTLISCALLIGWGGALAYEYMRAGNTPGWAMAYVGLTVLGVFVTLIWAVMSPARFVGLESAKNASFILGIWPPMYVGPMSYVRVVMTIITMFLPWVRAAKDGK